MHDFDLNLEEITKIEGQAALTIKVRRGKVDQLSFKITEFKRFYTQAIRGKPAAAIPQLVARICGTCSNAHLLCSIKAIENGFGITPSTQTQILRQLLINGLIIRDHALHLYLFALPDLFGRDSILEFDDHNPSERQLLEDAFTVKAAGNQLSILIGGRSVHAPWPMVGGFSNLPEPDQIQSLLKILNRARGPVLRLVRVFQNCPFRLEEKFDYAAFGDETFNYLAGRIQTASGQIIEPKDFGRFLNHVVIPYSQASAYQLNQKVYLVGALARLNLNKDKLHPQTKTELSEALARFPSTNIFDNNLAQAIEILECINQSTEILKNLKVKPEKPQPIIPRESTGVGTIEAPRGLLFYKLDLDAKGRIRNGQIVVPTGQNQIAIEKSLYRLVENNLDLEKEKLIIEIEKLIRAYDPCMSCATHFLKVDWV